MQLPRSLLHPVRRWRDSGEIRREQEIYLSSQVFGFKAAKARDSIYVSFSLPLFFLSVSNYRFSTIFKRYFIIVSKWLWTTCQLVIDTSLCLDTGNPFELTTIFVARIRDGACKLLINWLCIAYVLLTLLLKSYLLKFTCVCLKMIPWRRRILFSQEDKNNLCVSRNRFW